jgi:LPXTG-motif cell wall-anchored protein
MRAIRIVVALAAAVVAFSASPAGAQTSNASPCAPGGPNAQNPQYPPRDCGVAADRTEVGPGGKINLTGQCPQGTTSVTFRLLPGNADLGSATPDANGNYTKEVTIPAGTRPGNYRIEARCEGVLGAGVVRSVAITVVGAAALPRTGDSSAMPLTGAGIALVVMGGLAVLAVRRRREHTATS